MKQVTHSLSFLLHSQDNKVLLWDVRKATGPLLSLDQHNGSGSSNLASGGSGGGRRKGRVGGGEGGGGEGKGRGEEEEYTASDSPSL